MTTVTKVEPDAPAETAELRIGDKVLTLPIEHAIAGQSAINIGALLKDGHMTALDYGYANTASTRSARARVSRTCFASSRRCERGSSSPPTASRPGSCGFSCGRRKSWPGTISIGSRAKPSWRRCTPR